MNEEKKLLDKLINIVDTEYWDLITKYNELRDMTIMSSLRSTDPFKETTQLARLQGMGLGIYDLQRTITDEIERRKKEEEEKKKSGKK